MIKEELLIAFNIMKVQSILARKFDSLSVHGLAKQPFRGYRQTSECTC